MFLAVLSPVPRTPVNKPPGARAATATDTRTSKGRAPGAMTKARDQSSQEGCCGELYNPYCIKRWDCRWGVGRARSSVRVDFCLDGGSEECKFKV